MALKNLVSRQMSGINTIQISLVEETQPKDHFASRYFAFLKAIPGITNPNSPTGRSYDHKSAITISLQIEKMLALGFALKAFGEGKGDQYVQVYGSFEIYADTTKSNYGGDGGVKKAVKLGIMVNNKSQKKVITLSFMMGEKKAQGYFTPYESYAFGDIIYQLGMRALDLECNRVHDIITPKPTMQTLQPNQYENPVDDLQQTMDKMPF